MNSRAWYRYVGRPANHTMAMRFRAFFVGSATDRMYRRSRYASLSWTGTAFSVMGIILLASIIVATVGFALLFLDYAIAILLLGAVLNLMVIIGSNLVMHIRCENPPDHTWEAAVIARLSGQKKDS